MGFLESLVSYLPYCWPFVAYAVVSMVVSETLERLFQRRMGEPVWLVYPRRVQGLLPLLLGVFLGYVVFPDPIPTKIGAAGSALLFALGGAVGVLVFDPLSDFLKKRYGVGFRLPGDDSECPPKD